MTMAERAARWALVRMVESHCADAVNERNFARAVLAWLGATGEVESDSSGNLIHTSPVGRKRVALSWAPLVARVAQGTNNADRMQMLIRQFGTRWPNEVTAAEVMDWACADVTHDDVDAEHELARLAAGLERLAAL